MEQQQQQTAVVVQHLDVIAAKARKGLRKVAEGEDKTMEGWLEYGAALLEGREQFDGDREFGQWLCSCNLQLDGPSAANDQAAAIWAAGYPEQFRETKKANPRVRTVRGLHAKWKVKDKPAPAKVEPTEDDLKTISNLQALAERGATEAERESAQAKLDAYTSVFGDQQEEVKEKAEENREMRDQLEPDSVIIHKMELTMKDKGVDWAVERLLEAMLNDDELFKKILPELTKQKGAK